MSRGVRSVAESPPVTVGHRRSPSVSSLRACLCPPSSGSNPVNLLFPLRIRTSGGPSTLRSAAAAPCPPLGLSDRGWLRGPLRRGQNVRVLRGSGGERHGITAGLRRVRGGCRCGGALGIWLNPGRKIPSKRRSCVPLPVPGSFTIKYPSSENQESVTSINKPQEQKD